MFGYPLFLPVCHLVAGTERLAQRKVALEVRKHCARKRWVIPVDHHVFAVSHLNSRIAQLLNRLRAACLPSGDEDFDPRAVIDLTRITYTRLLADLQAADASVWINRRSVAALVPQLWSAIADVIPGSRAQGRLSSVLRLALALYAMASASVFIEGDDLVLDER